MKIGYYLDLEVREKERLKIPDDELVRYAKYKFAQDLYENFIPDPKIQIRESERRFIDERYFLFTEETINSVCSEIRKISIGQHRSTVDILDRIINMLLDDKTDKLEPPI